MPRLQQAQQMGKEGYDIIRKNIPSYLGVGDWED
jgi:hypothetical protein